MTAVYILLCANGQYYVGSTNNLADRLKEHEGSATALYVGAKFTKAHMPVKLVYTKGDRGQAPVPRLKISNLHVYSLICQCKGIAA